MKTLIPMSIAALLLASTAAVAQDQIAFDRLDSNGDGMLSYGDLLPAYPDLTQAQFDAADFDGDDFVDPTEFTSIGNTVVEAQAGGAAAAPAIDAPLFETVDRNGDGKISYDDLAGWPGLTHDMFDTADIDGDDFLDRTQYEALKNQMPGAFMERPANVALGMASPGGGLPNFDLLDSDGDGKIDFTTLKTELPELTQEQFDAADIDGDDFLDRTQYEGLDI